MFEHIENILLDAVTTAEGTGTNKQMQKFACDFARAEYDKLDLQFKFPKTFDFLIRMVLIPIGIELAVDYAKAKGFIKASN